jgi:hypothetical protein
MSVRETVRDAQRRLAALDADYARAVAKLNRASARRAEVLAEQDRLVALAHEDADRTVVVMADAVGAQLTASVLGLDEADVRRVVKSRNPRAPATAPRRPTVCSANACDGLAGNRDLVRTAGSATVR